MSGYKHGGWIQNRHLYNVWSCMRSRCHNKNHPQYKDYGGRGISVCNEWNDFRVFREWALSNGYVDRNNRDDCSIDRIDVNGNYDPSNCRWTNRKVQMNNRRANVFLTYKGETKTLSQWADALGICYSTFMSRYDRGLSIERIVTTPVRVYGKDGVRCPY